MTPISDAALHHHSSALRNPFRQSRPRSIGAAPRLTDLPDKGDGLSQSARPSTRFKWLTRPPRRLNAPAANESSSPHRFPYAVSQHVAVRSKEPSSSRLEPADRRSYHSLNSPPDYPPAAHPRTDASMISATGDNLPREFSQAAEDVSLLISVLIAAPAWPCQINRAPPRPRLLRPIIVLAIASGWLQAIAGSHRREHAALTEHSDRNLC